MSSDHVLFMPSFLTQKTNSFVYAERKNLTSVVARRFASTIFIATSAPLTRTSPELALFPRKFLRLAANSLGLCP